MASEVNKRRHDIVLVFTMAILAACGLVYEYLMAHFAGRILGSVEPTIYAMIGLMIVAMGVGAFSAKWINSIYQSFAWVELTIGLLGGISILVMSASVAFVYLLPQWIQSTYGIDFSIELAGGFIETLRLSSKILPYAFGFVIGFFVGMEIPLIARIRENIHGKHLEHNLGTMYGADYIGAGIGAAIWITVCLKVPVTYAAVGTAGINVLVGLIFLYIYRHKINHVLPLWIGHGAVALILFIMAVYGVQWMSRLNDTLFKDDVVYQVQTPYQNVVITERTINANAPKITSLYINGRLQFASNDERIYHAYLTTPVMLAANRNSHLLIIGGGDGLALRDLLKWNPRSITLIDLDSQLIDLFSGNDLKAPQTVSETLTTINRNAFDDSRVTVIREDAFVEIENQIEEIASGAPHYDAIVIDLPDPSHPDLNKLYSSFFYSRIRNILTADGAIGIQSTSPYHAKEAFQAIGKTLADAGFLVDQYHANVPSFGEWGWTLGTLTGASGLTRIERAQKKIHDNHLLSKGEILASFIFPSNFYDNIGNIQINHLGSHAIFQYHQRAWQQYQGTFYAGE
tara:strand:+ start:807 stop:2519 length:1713 start_codon:yes stop_codon:yes gene_type:complete